VRAFLAGWLRQLAIPTLIVTHDPEDVRALGERVLVLEQGRVVQSGPWRELVLAPATPFVAELTAAGSA
jgi:molybdate transport system ATP-binding protein